MDRRLVFLFLQCCLFTVSFGLTPRQVYDVLADKIQGVAFDVALLREDMTTFKQQQQQQRPAVTGKDYGEAPKENIDTSDTKAGINVKGIETFMQNFERKLKTAFMKEKTYLRDRNKNMQNDAANHREHVSEALDRIENRLTTEMDALKDLIDKERTEFEKEQQNLEDQIHADIKDAKQKIKELEEEPIRKILRGLPWWGDWSSWSACYKNCTGESSGRVQSRTRNAVLAGDQADTQATPTETETRPCNAVQFAGCIKTYGSADNYGVTYDFADQLAQATCTAMSPGGYVNAVRRQCSSSSPTCATICSRAGRTCFNQLHVYRSSPVLERASVGQRGLQMYKYNSCGGQFCGPNFCCCRS